MAFASYPYPSLDYDYQGIDFAGLYSPIDQALADQMYADGIRFVGRYLFPQRYPNGKGVTRQEVDYYLNAGLKVFFYYEVDSTDALSGYDGGYQAGLNCLQEANYIGVPIHTNIYCCCDMGVTDTQADGVVMSYLEGFKTALPNYYCGIYGGANVMESAYNHFVNEFRCQAGAWGDLEFSPINVRQWYINTMNLAAHDGKIRISNITIDSNGFAKWRGNPVDILSAGSLATMWNGDIPVPPSPPPPVPPETNTDKMPIWFYLRPF